jgi:hypothetical protein
MILFDISDIRFFAPNDLLFLRQFGDSNHAYRATRVIPSRPDDEGSHKRALAQFEF